MTLESRLSWRPLSFVPLSPNRWAAGSRRRIFLFRRIIYRRRMNRDAIEAEPLEIEGMLLDGRLKDEDRHALHGAQQALRNVLDRETWHPASQTFSLLVH